MGTLESSDVVIEILDPGATLTLGPSDAIVEQTIDLSEHFPTELLPDETETVGPLVFAGDQWWNPRVGPTVITELHDEPVVFAVVDMPPRPPCVDPAAPVPPVEEPPRFTG